MTTLWTPKDVCDYFDSHPNVTIRQISYLSGHSIADVKRILMGN